MNTPFQVICVNAKNTLRLIQEGNTYTVVEIAHFHCCNRLVYRLEEINWPATQCICGHMHPNALYNPDRFVPLSEIDENEMLREYNHQTQTV